MKKLMLLRQWKMKLKFEVELDTNETKDAELLRRLMEIVEDLKETLEEYQDQ